MGLIDRGFRGAGAGYVPGDISEMHRLRHYKNFVDCSGTVLDVGGKNWIGDELARHFDCEIENTLPCDFDDTLLTPRTQYDVILCFEVIEHLMNPLTFLRNIGGRVARGGAIYLSTPLNRLISIYCHETHVVEYKQTPLKMLLDKAQLRVERSEVFLSFPARFYFRGLRPALRLFTQKVQLYKLTPTDQREGDR
jgi:SAM-dependent methyltransferase